jgi:hypothetical protein
VRARRGAISDVYVEGGQAAVLVGTDVVVLSPLATTLLGLVGEDWADLRDLAAGLVEAFGAPPAGTGPTSATVAALHVLAERRVVELEETIELEG